MNDHMVVLTEITKVARRVIRGVPVDVMQLNLAGAINRGAGASLRHTEPTGNPFCLRPAGDALALLRCALVLVSVGSVLLSMRPVPRSLDLSGAGEMRPMPLPRPLIQPRAMLLCPVCLVLFLVQQTARLAIGLRPRDRLIGFSTPQACFLFEKVGKWVHSLDYRDLHSDSQYPRLSYGISRL